MAKIAKKSKEVGEKSDASPNEDNTKRKKNPLTTVLRNITKKKVKPKKAIALSNKSASVTTKKTKESNSPPKLEGSLKSDTGSRTKNVVCKAEIPKVGSDEQTNTVKKDATPESQKSSIPNKEGKKNSSKDKKQVRSSENLKNCSKDDFKVNKGNSEKSVPSIEITTDKNEVILERTSKSTEKARKGSEKLKSNSKEKDKELSDTTLEKTKSELKKLSIDNKQGKNEVSKSPGKTKKTNAKDVREESKIEKKGIRKDMKHDEKKVPKKEKEEIVPLKEEGKIKKKTSGKSTTTIKKNITNVEEIEDKKSILNVLEDNKKHSKDMTTLQSDAVTEKAKVLPVKKMAKKISLQAKSKIKGKVAKKVPTDIYKRRHNIGRRVAAGRVCSYKETEVSFAFPDNYWTVPQVKTSSSSSNTNNTNKGIASMSAGTKTNSDMEDDEVQFNFEAQKNREETNIDNECSKNNKNKKRSSSRSPSPNSGKSLSKSKRLSPKTVTVRAPILDAKKQNTLLNKVRKFGQSKFKPSKKVTRILAKKKRKSKYQGIVPRAPRIQRTACLNANAINSLMYDYSAPPKRPKIEQEENNDEDVTSVTSDKNSYSSSTEEEFDTEIYDDSDSDYVDDQDEKRTDVGKQRNQKEKNGSPAKKELASTVRKGKKTGKSKEKAKEKEKVNTKKKKKKTVKRKSQEISATIFVPLPKRMASLNAQAIMAACKELDEMKIPIEPKQPKEAKKSKDKDGDLNHDKSLIESQQVKPAKSALTNKSKSPKSPSKASKSSVKEVGKSSSDEDLIPEQLRRITYANISPSRAKQHENEIKLSSNVVNVPYASANKAPLSSSKDPYEFVDVVEPDEKSMTTPRRLMSNNSSTAKVPVSSPELIVLSSSDKSPPENANYKPTGFVPVRPAISTAKPTPHYPPHIQYPHLSHPVPPVVSMAHAPFPHGGFRPSFQPQQQQPLQGRNRATNISDASLSTPLPPSNAQQMPQQYSSHYYRPSHPQAYVPSSSSVSSAVTFQQQQQQQQQQQNSANLSAFVPTSQHLPIQAMPSYPPHSQRPSQQAHQQLRQSEQIQLPNAVQQQQPGYDAQHASANSLASSSSSSSQSQSQHGAGFNTVNSTHNTHVQMKQQPPVARGETPASSGRSSVSSITEQQITPPGQTHNHAHKSTSMGNTATYPYPHGGNTPTTNSMLIQGTNAAGIPGQCQPFIHPAVGLSGMENYSVGSPAGYPIMTYPRHYGNTTVFGNYSHQIPASHQNSGSAGNVSGTTANIRPQNQPPTTSGGPQNIYMGYGYYQPAGPLLHTPAGANPFHMLPQQHMKGFFAPSALTHKPGIPHNQPPFNSQDIKAKSVSYQPRPALNDTGMAAAAMKKPSPSKRGSHKLLTNTERNQPKKDSCTKPKDDVIDLSVENTKPSDISSVSHIVTTSAVSSFIKKADLIRNIIGTSSSSGSGGEEASPGKQTKDILDLDSKKVKVHRGAVGESTDRNSPLKVTKPSKKSSSGNSKTDRTGFPVQTYKFEAKAHANTGVGHSVTSFMQGTNVENSLQTVAATRSINAVTIAGVAPYMYPKHAETKTVAANMSIPFYSSPLSVQTGGKADSAVSLMSGAQPQLFMGGKDFISLARSNPGIAPQRNITSSDNVSFLPIKKKSNNFTQVGSIVSHNKTADTGMQQGNIESNNSRINSHLNVITTSHMVKPVMPVLPIPSVPFSSHQDRITDNQYPQKQEHLQIPSNIVSLGIGAASSYIVTSGGYKPVTTVGYSDSGVGNMGNTKIAEDLKVMPDEKVYCVYTDGNGGGGKGNSDPSDKLSKSGRIDEKAPAKSPIRVGMSQLVSGNLNNSARGDGKKGTKKGAGKNEGKSPKKEISKVKTPTRPDTLKIKPDSTSKVSKSKAESPRQKSQKGFDSPKKLHSLESPKQKLLESPRYKGLYESPKQRGLSEIPKFKTTSESPKSKPLLESPKHGRILDVQHKYKSISSPKQKSETKSKPDSPRQNPFKIKLDFSATKLKFESKSRREEQSGTAAPDGMKSPGNGIKDRERRRSAEERKHSPVGIGSRKRIHSATVTHSGWQWEGQPEFKPMSTQGEPPMLRKCYPAVRHDDGDIVSLRDCVLVKSGPRKKDIPFVAKIAAFYEHAPSGEMMMSVLWYYRPEQTEMERLPRRERCEIFASRHRDVVPVACIDDKAYVLTFNEYCRFKSEQRRMAENGSNRPAIIPKPSNEPTSVVTPLPPLHAATETIFLCRRVYDVKLKRILKNPQASYSYSSPNSSKPHTPTPSSKSPSPKSGSPDKQNLSSSGIPSGSSIEIMQAILTSSLAGQNVELPINWGLPGNSSTDFLEVSDQHYMSHGPDESAADTKNLEFGISSTIGPSSARAFNFSRQKTEASEIFSTHDNEKHSLPQDVPLKSLSSADKTGSSDHDSKPSFSADNVEKLGSNLEHKEVVVDSRQLKSDEDCKYGLGSTVQKQRPRVKTPEKDSGLIKAETTRASVSSSNDKTKDSGSELAPKKIKGFTKNELFVSSSKQDYDTLDTEDDEGDLVMDLDASESDSEVNSSKFKPLPTSVLDYAEISHRTKSAIYTEVHSTVENKPSTSKAFHDTVKKIKTDKVKGEDMKVGSEKDNGEITSSNETSSSKKSEESESSVIISDVVKSDLCKDDTKSEPTSSTVFDTDIELNDDKMNNSSTASTSSIGKKEKSLIIDTGPSSVENKTILKDETGVDSCRMSSQSRILIVDGNTVSCPSDVSPTIMNESVSIVQSELQSPTANINEPEKGSNNQIVQSEIKTSEETAISLLSKISDSLSEKQVVKSSSDDGVPIHLESGEGGSNVSSAAGVEVTSSKKAEIYSACEASKVIGKSSDIGKKGVIAGGDCSINTSGEQVSLLGEGNNEESMGSDNSDEIVSSESSTEVSRDASNIDECTRSESDNVPITFGLSSDSISIEICSNIAVGGENDNIKLSNIADGGANENIKLPSYLEQESEVPTSSSVQVDSVSTSISKVATSSSLISSTQRQNTVGKVVSSSNSVVNDRQSNIGKIATTAASEVVAGTSTVTKSSVPIKSTRSDNLGLLSTPVTLVSSTPVTLVSSTPRTLVSSTPTTLVSSTPTTLVSSTPVTLVSSKPVTLVSSTPVTLVSSTPRTLVSSTPTTLVSSTPRTLVSSTPTTLVSSTPVTLVSSSVSPKPGTSTGDLSVPVVTSCLKSPTSESGFGRIEQIVSRIKMTGSFAAMSASSSLSTRVTSNDDSLSKSPKN